MWMRKLTN